MLFLQIDQVDMTKIYFAELGEFIILNGLIGALIGFFFKNKNGNQLVAIALAPLVASAIVYLIVFAAVLSCENFDKFKEPFTIALKTTQNFSFRIIFLCTLPSMIGCFVAFKFYKKAN